MSHDFPQVLWSPRWLRAVNPAGEFLMQSSLLDVPFAMSAGPLLFLRLVKMMDILNSWLTTCGVIQIKKGNRENIISQEAAWYDIISSTLLWASNKYLLLNKAGANINSCYQKSILLEIIRNKLLMACVIELQIRKEKLALSLTGWCR